MQKEAKGGERGERGEGEGKGGGDREGNGRRRKREEEEMEGRGRINTRKPGNLFLADPRCQVPGYIQVSGSLLPISNFNFFFFCTFQFPTKEDGKVNWQASFFF